MRKTDIHSSIASGMDAASESARYDAACKRLLSEKIILAHIMKGCVKEFENCAIKDIAEKYIEGEPTVGEFPVERDVTPRIHGISDEDKTLGEGTVVYDIRFIAYAPTTGEPIKLIVNIEAQNQSKPGYSLTKRAIYYCGRLMSSQHGTEFDHSDYDKVKKVYSIWICPKPQADRANTITAYRITEKNLIGSVREDVQSYDLMCAVMVCLGDAARSDKHSLLRMLEVLFSDTIKVNDKKEILESDFSIPMTEQIEKEVHGMCNLSQDIWDRAVQVGVKTGVAEDHVKSIHEMRRDNLSDETIAKYLRISVAEVAAVPRTAANS